MFFTEYDDSSYKMRYKNTWTIFKDRKTNALFQAYVSDVEDGKWCLRSLEENGYKDKRKLQETIIPAYYPIQAGYYPVLGNESRIIAISRKLAKSFLVGYNHNTYNATDPLVSRKVSPDVVPDLLSPVTVVNVEDALRNHGPISRRMYVTKTRVYYLDKVVGMRNKRNFVVDQLFKSEIEDCLRGHECTVTL